MHLYYPKSYKFSFLTFLKISWGERIIDIHDSFMSMYHSIVIDLNGISYKKEDEKTESTETAQSD